MTVKGLVEIRLLNKDTLEIEHTVVQENTITHAFFANVVINGVLYYSTGTFLGQNIIISDDINESVQDFWWVQNPLWGFVPIGAVAVQNFPAVGVNPPYTEFTRRFDPPAAGITRTINTVGLTTDTAASYNNATVTAYVKLTSPCLQTDTQLLDVVYRVRWVQDLAQTNGFNSSPAIFQDQAFTLGLGGIGDYAMPINVYSSTFQNPHDPTTDTNYHLAYLDGCGADDINFSGTGITVTQGVTSAGTYPLFKRTTTISATTSSAIGKILGSEYYMRLASTYGTPAVSSWKNLAPPTGYYIQPIHSHSATTFSSATPTPFLDSSPSSGTGKLIGGGTWTNPDYPELYLVKMTVGGAVGTASYQFWKRNHFGFNGVNYNDRHVQSGAASTKYASTGPSVPAPWQPFSGSHGVLPHYLITEYATVGGTGTKAVKYDFTRVVTTDDTGVTLLSLPTSQVVNYDATTTPALPVTSVRQVSVNASTGDIWVACANTGLWKIDVVGNAITHITVATHSVPSEQAYGVDIGRNNSIWAVLNGGIITSNDNGASWTTYNTTTTPNFTFAGITDNNWNSVYYLKVDPTHIDDRLALVRDPRTAVLTTTGIVWWSRGTPTATAVTVNDATVLWARNNTCGVDVSDTSGFWVMSGNSSVPRRLTYGTNTLTNIGTTSYIRGVFFEKGPANQDCFIYTPSSASPYTVTLYDINLASVVSSTATTGGSIIYTSPINPLMVYMGRGIFATVRWSSTGSTAAFGWTIGNIMSSSNPMTGPFSYLMWDKYGWDGATWVLNNAGSKLTHASPAALTNGVTLAFQNGVSGTSFIANDYYTFGVVKGIMKDNSTSYASVLEMYWAPTKVGTTFGGIIRTYPSTGAVTWKRKSSQLTVNPDNSLVNKSATRPFGLYAISNNRVFGDFSITGTISPAVGAVRTWVVGLTVALGGVYSTAPDWHTNNTWENLFGFRAVNNTFQPEVAGSVAGTSTTITVANTSWEIRRVGTTITFYVGGVLKHTLTAQAQHSFAVRAMYVQLLGTYNSQVLEPIAPITVVSSGTGYYTEAGVALDGTGVYDPKFLSVDSHSSAKPTFQMSLNGVPVTFVSQDATTLPGPGEVNVIGEYGDFIFNPADVGKTVTGTYKYVVMQ